MEFAEVVARRRMVRNYDPDRPVPSQVLERILGYAIHAPSAGFSQGWHFLVLQTATDRGRFWAASASADSDPAAAPDTWLGGMRNAPVLILCFSD